MKIVFLDAISLGETSLSPIASLGDFVSYPTSTVEEGLERVKDADVLIVNKFKVNEALLSAAPKLKLICEAATGVDNIDLKAASQRNIPVRNVAGYSTDSVAQLAFTQILDMVLCPDYFDRRVKDGTYFRSGVFSDYTRPFKELSGKVMGIIGLGTIGSKVAAIAEVFGMRVIYFSTNGIPHSDRYECVDLETLLKTSDVVSIHSPLNDKTRGLIGYNELRMMKRSAILVNVARGRIVDEADLARAIDEELIVAAATDVFSLEPLPADNPLMNTRHPERLHLTPHIAWASVEAMDRLVAGIADNIKKGF